MSDTAAKTPMDRRLSPILTNQDRNVIGSEKYRKYGAAKEDSSFEIVCDNSLMMGSGGRHSAYTDLEAKQHNIFHDKGRTGNLILLPAA